jgi:hypothetical protein
MKTSSCVSALLLVAMLGTGTALAQTQIKWQGYTWMVKNGPSEGPGPNPWSSSNVWVDPSGFLHMKIAQKDGKWSCAEIWTTEALGFGTYQCHVEGQIDKLDPEVIFSMFSYEGPDGIKEIDIEYSKWGKPGNKNGWWTVWPNDTSKKETEHSFDFSLNGTYTTSRYWWSSSEVKYSLLGGHQPVGSDVNFMDGWEFKPAEAPHAIPQSKLPLHFNLWLFEGKPPTDGKPVEIIVHDFTFLPEKS